MQVYLRERKWGDGLAILIYEEDKRLRKTTANIIMQLYNCDSNDVDIYSFDNPDSAIRCANDGCIETAFISMDDKFGRGFYLAKRMKNMDSEIKLITMANELRFEPELTRLKINGYIIGDRTKDKIEKEINNLYD